ncbi:MAG: alkyl sulfatase dimerization domain-containing protein [Actinophytocola sp.]|uniref:alkyl sulfatase dimerization domain-containing protein n=1 Tax=Actinophytocola sp. TaxID=1872138 RepID=UPI003D6C0F37
MLMNYAERMWRGEIGMDGLLVDGSIWGTAHELTDDVAVVAGFSNVIAFRTGAGLLLFDTGIELAAAATHQAVRRWCADPVRYAIYSHGHVDHVGGMAPFDAEPGPKPVVIAHEAVPRRFDRYVRTSGYNELINRRQFGLPELRWPREYRYPDRTVRKVSTVELGGLTFTLRHARGETDDHLWAHVPELDMVLPGDLFIWNAPNCGNPQKAQRYPAEWAAALRAMAELDAKFLVPSHGPPVVGADRVREALTTTAEYLESLLDQTLALMNRGARLDEIIHTVAVPPHLAEKPYLRPAYDEPEFIVRNIWRLYGGWWDGAPASLKPPPASREATVLAELCGGPRALADRATRALAEDEPRIAARLAELAVLAAPSDEDIRATHRTVFAALAEAATSTMARGIYRDAI